MHGSPGSILSRSSGISSGRAAIALSGLPPRRTFAVAGDSRVTTVPWKFSGRVRVERAPLSRLADQTDFAPQEAGQLAADSQTQTGAAVATARAGVGLLKRFENDLLLVGRNADAGVGHFEGDGERSVVEGSAIGAPAPFGHADAQRHAPLRRELEGIGQQVLEHLQEPLEV